MKETLLSRAKNDLQEIESCLNSQSYLLWVGKILPGIQDRTMVFNELNNSFKGAKELDHDKFLYNSYVKLEKQLTLGWIKDILSKTINDIHGAKVLVRESLPPLSLTETQTSVVANKIEITSKKQETTEFKHSVEKIQTTTVDQKSQASVPPPPSIPFLNTTIKKAPLTKSIVSPKPVTSFEDELKAKVQKRRIAIKGEKSSRESEDSFKTSINPLAQSILSNPSSQKFFQDFKEDQEEKFNYNIPVKSYE